ncbi:urease accessory protein UreF [Verticiella sediminum]|uniref:Urease accessory protein UreF n=1 Tax=Verticiella sediminum TaxID=1247510 RepID=A0A556ARK0_9BURK|nr:urease accessory UreF family protein [Verticiella sediminum]TSH95556.1 urease accessory protein UreF [Verticiella sediminum]
MPLRAEPDTAASGLALAGLLQLVSPALPIGGFSYSQGLEAAADAGLVCDAASAGQWIAGGLEVLARGEATMLVRQFDAWQRGDFAAVGDGNDTLLAWRESAEFRLETEQMGGSLARLAGELGLGSDAERAALARLRPIALATAFAYAALALGVNRTDCVLGWLYAWLENQVAAAIKAVPLGQLAGQRMLHGLRAAVVDAAHRAGSADDAQISTFAPQLAILSARHETQYSRLFRS